MLSLPLSAKRFGARILTPLVSLFALAASFPASAATPSFRVIGYAMERADPAQIDAGRLTHLIYAFALVSDRGDAYLPSPTAPAYLAKLNALKEKNPHLKVLLSIGGWGADHFSDAALTEASRDKFARSALALMERHRLDGIDLDWEYPGQRGSGIRFRPEDKQNFTLLLKAFREQLDVASAVAGRTGAERYVLTAATGDREYLIHTEMPVLHRYLDWINVMTYDRFGAWSKTTGHHAALFTSRSAPAGVATTETATDDYREAGVPPSKIVIGAAFYGRGWTGVTAKSEGLFQPYEKVLDEHLSYRRLAKEYIGQQGYQRRWDAEAQAPYLWNADTRTFISYEDEESLKAKARFVKERKLGGVMYWEQASDAEDGLLLRTLHEGLR